MLIPILVAYKMPTFLDPSLPNLRRRGEARSHGLFLRESKKRGKGTSFKRAWYPGSKHTTKMWKTYGFRRKMMYIQNIYIYIYTYVYIYIYGFSTSVLGYRRANVFQYMLWMFKNSKNWHSPSPGTPVQKGIHGGYNQWRWWLYQVFIGVNHQQMAWFMIIM